MAFRRKPSKQYGTCPIAFALRFEQGHCSLRIHLLAGLNRSPFGIRSKLKFIFHLWKLEFMHYSPAECVFAGGNVSLLFEHLQKYLAPVYSSGEIQNNAISMESIQMTLLVHCRRRNDVNCDADITESFYQFLFIAFLWHSCISTMRK